MNNNYYNYIASHGRARPRGTGQEEEARYLGRNLSTAHHAIIAYIGPSMVGFALLREKDTRTLHLSRICSLKEVNGEDISTYQIGTNLFNQISQHFPTTKQITAEMHESAENFAQKVGGRPISTPRREYGTTIIDYEFRLNS